MTLEKVETRQRGNAAGFGFLSAWDDADKPEHIDRPRKINLIMRRCRVSEPAAHLIAELASIGSGARL